MLDNGEGTVFLELPAATTPRAASRPPRSSTRPPTTFSTPNPRSTPTRSSAAPGPLQRPAPRGPRHPCAKRTPGLPRVRRSRPGRVPKSVEPFVDGGDLQDGPAANGESCRSGCHGPMTPHRGCRRSSPAVCMICGPPGLRASCPASGQPGNRSWPTRIASMRPAGVQLPAGGRGRPGVQKRPSGLTLGRHSPAERVIARLEEPVHPAPVRYRPHRAGRAAKTILAPQVRQTRAP